MTEDRNSKIEIRAIEIIWRNREEKLWKNKQSLKNMWNNIKISSIYIITDPGENRQNR